VRISVRPFPRSVYYAPIPALKLPRTSGDRPALALLKGNEISVFAGDELLDIANECLGIDRQATPSRPSRNPT
jgi:hypothetical protein